MVSGESVGDSEETNEVATLGLEARRMGFLRVHHLPADGKIESRRPNRDELSGGF